MLRIGYILEPGFQVMAFGSLSVFELANLLPGGPRYEVTLLSEAGGRVRSSMGTTVETGRFGTRRFDTVIVGGSISPVAATPSLRKFLQRSLKSSRRVASVCTGAFALASAGILNGRRATTHWAYAREFETQFPEVTLDADRIFVIDGPVWTSAGMSAGIDLRSAWSSATSEPNRRAPLRENSSSTTVAPVASRSTPYCSSSMQRPIEFRTLSRMRRRI